MLPDGFYLSAYIHIDSLSNEIRWWHRHDQNISLWELEGESVKLVEYWELERLTGQKQHYQSFASVNAAKEFISKLLATYNLCLDDIIEVIGCPGLGNWTYENNFIKNIPYHTLCHLFSGLFLDSDKFNNENIVALVLDGGPDRVVDNEIPFEYEYLACYFEKGEVKGVMPLRFSPGRLWFNAREKFGLREGSLMALQTAMDVRSTIKVPEILFEGSHDVYESAISFLNESWDKIFASDNITVARINGDLFKDFSEQEVKISMCIKLLDEVCTMMMNSIIRKLLQTAAIDPRKSILSITGGFALNCPTNSYLMKKYNFKEFCSPPCVNDSGISFGAALMEFYSRRKKIRFSLNSSYHGPILNVTQARNSELFKSFVVDESNLDFSQVVSDIKSGPIVWLQGRSEIGPRALGHRSILVDPRFMHGKYILNDIKQREWWRPVAPIVLQEDICDWFDDAYPSPYMLHAFKVKEEKRDLIPVIKHLNDTARVQTISEQQNHLLYQVLHMFKQATGIPMVGNTSLNDKGEPIIETVEQAINFALRKGINVLYMDGTRIKLDLNRHYTESRPLAREHCEILGAANSHKIAQRFYDAGASREMISLLCRMPFLRRHFNLNTVEGVDRFIQFGMFAERSRRKYIATSAHTEYLRLFNQWKSKLED
ncbi:MULTISPECIES: carbamoyltransferase C-terminal domain-containing protein [Photorhabdus]|uniref:Carbamoyltransferase n=2 Tax=Photorhabdus asymbiotica TaxID=291112 RepID=C7BLN9_PHOAA|nr:carbamoyltransferase C-terminal domain-containing protein [Photorhabdus asymbiotica]RKS57158.1 putative NodU family carbamoyl transferase [Photorhabdus asymbiotica]CAQ84486.1 conserved hypothetical protein [Photorhabdus asymbiotica]